MFVWAVTIASDKEEQEEETLKPWVDPHKLKKVNGTWYKEGRRVITGTLMSKQMLIKS